MKLKKPPYWNHRETATKGSFKHKQRYSKRYETTMQGDKEKTLDNFGCVPKNE